MFDSFQMDGLADFSSASSSLPWIWIIEYLASCKEVDTTILHELIEMTPEIPDDLAKAAREMVALRCLEDLFGSSDKINSDGLSVAKKKVEIALSESCEDVLQKILQETSASDLKISGPELLKWDVHPFIVHKRASMPKCALQLLKDTILEGTHPLAASLKESSGLMCVNECGTSRVGELDHNSQALPEKENVLPLTREDGDGRPGDDFRIKNMLPSKRGRDDMVIGDMAGQSNEVQVECDLNYNAKKHKQDAIRNHQSPDQISFPTRIKEIVEPLSGRDLVTGEKGSRIANQPQEECLEESQFPEDGFDYCDDSRRLGQNGDVNDVEIQRNQVVDRHGQNGDVNGDQIQHNQVVDRLEQNGGVNDDQIQHIQVVNGHTADKPVRDETMDEFDVTEPRISKGVTSVATQQKDIADESRGEMVHSRGEQTSSDNDEFLNERIDVAVKKSHFLSSQSSLGHDSLATSGWTEKDLCVKCNKGGQLLSCSTCTCPLVVHENCLGFPVKFDEKETFHCPFCAYALSFSEYLEAKKKASVARKELTAFIQMSSQCHHRDLADRLNRKDPGHSRNGDKYIHENGHLGGQENKLENQNGQLLHDANDHLCQKQKAKKKNVEPSASRVNVNSPSREVEANTFSRRDCVSNVDKLTEENIADECPSERGVEAQPESTLPRPQFDCDKVACTNTYVAAVDHTEAEGELQKEVARSESIDASKEPVIALNINGDENSEGENDKSIISNYSIRFRRQETHYTYPASPQLRRKKVPWTAKEEEMLKKGVRKYTSGADRTIPWKKILEFGSSVFSPCRTTIDLKDKWRNMCKGSPRSR